MQRMAGQFEENLQLSEQGNSAYVALQSIMFIEELFVAVRQSLVGEFTFTSLMIVIAKENAKQPCPFAYDFLQNVCKKGRHQCIIANSFTIFQSTVTHFRHLIMQQLQRSSTKFCSYNFVLNEAPNNSDVTCVANNYRVEQSA